MKGVNLESIDLDGISLKWYGDYTVFLRNSKISQSRVIIFIITMRQVKLCEQTIT